MTRIELIKRWKISETLLRNARAVLVCPLSPASEEFQRLDRIFNETFAANEHELALDILAEMGLLVLPRGGFWRDMERAALNMMLEERASQFRTHFLNTRPPGHICKPASPPPAS